MSAAVPRPLPGGGGGDTWVQLVPPGAFAGRDGRRFRLDDAAGVIARSLAAAPGRMLPVDYDHATERAFVGPGGRPPEAYAPAAGWIVALEDRGGHPLGGVWGLVEWTPRGRERVEGREYRFLSPVFRHQPDGLVLRLDRAGLTNVPNLDLAPFDAAAAAPGASPPAAPPAPSTPPAPSAPPGAAPLPGVTGVNSVIINNKSTDGLFTGYKTLFQQAFQGAPSTAARIAMTVPSGGREEVYAWLGQIPGIREWLGDRVIHSLSRIEAYAIRNRKFESTFALAREDIADDRYGVYTPVVAEMGRAARQHPDELVYALLSRGFTTTCYDGQYFFDPEHVVGGAGAAQVVSNVQPGTGAPWFLLDTTRSVKPLIYQEREGYTFTQLTQEGSEEVFIRDRYLYGVRARVNVGFGLWQLAFGSRAPLTAANYEAARAAMMAQRGEGGRPLGVTPSLMVVPPALEGAARRLLAAATGNNGASNEWAGSAELIVTPYLA